MNNTLSLNKTLSYIAGFIAGDGHLNKSSYSVTIGLSSRDKEILEKISQGIHGEFPLATSTLSDSIRSTNFVKDYRVSTLYLNSRELIEFLTDSMGIPRGKKSNIIKPPQVPFSEYDFLRGYIDADGALGIAPSTNQPFITLVASSEEFKDYVCDFLQRELGITKRMKRNTRDNVYNICIFNEHAQELVRKLYYLDNPISLNRKCERAREVLSWIRPEGLKRSPNKRTWIEEEDLIVLSNTDEIASTLLNRSIKSIKSRRWRLCPPTPKTTFVQKHYSSEEDILILTLSIQEASSLLNRSERTLLARKRKLLKKM